MEQPRTKEQPSKMSLHEKLDLINQEIQTLHHFCISKGFSDLQVEKCAQPVLQPVREAQWKQLRTRLLWLAVFVAVIAALYHFDPAYRLFCAYSRLATIQVGYIN